MNNWLFFIFTIYLVGVTFSHSLPHPGLEWLNCTRSNEEHQCGLPCQTRCATLGERCQVMNIKCNDACYCIDGYARDDKDVCIQIKDCPPKRRHQ